MVAEAGLEPAASGVMSCSQPDYPLQHNGFLPFLPLFLNDPGGRRYNMSWLVHSLISWYGSAYGSRINCMNDRLSAGCS